MAPMPTLQLPPQARGLLPKLGAGLLLLANIGFLMFNSMESKGPELWKGPVMGGKLFPLPERPQRLHERIQAESKKDFAANEPLRDLMEEEKAHKDGTAPKEAKPTQQMGLHAMPKDAFVVQAGSFVLKLGAETLLERLRKNGLQPQVVEREEMVQLNDVQAGPFATLEEAKIAEAKLRAGGLSVKAVETWEGFIITLGKFYMLGYAVEMMERAEKLKISPLRMVKVESALKVQKVLMGPFNTKESAKQVSVRVSQLGLAVPIIKTVADEEKEAEAARKLIEGSSSAPTKTDGAEAAKKAPPPTPVSPPKWQATTPQANKESTSKAEPASPAEDGPDEPGSNDLEGESLDTSPPAKPPTGGKKNAPKPPLPQGKG